MASTLPLIILFVGSLAALSACVAARPGAEFAPVYLGAEPVGLGGDLYGFLVTMKGARGVADLEAYVDCAVAGYTLEKNYGFARRVRTKVRKEGGVWAADAVYTISKTLPRGLKTIDAEVAVADCADRGIPTV